ncbi:MAG: hypothetical protein Q9227_005904 [Pyrenula ochraceoflavens]
MAAIPVPFSDIAKPTNDLLNKDFYHTQAGVTLTETWTTGNNLDTKIEFENNIANGFKAELLGNYLPNDKSYGGKLNFFFKQPNYHSRVFVDPFKGPTATADVTIGHEGYIAGAEASYDWQTAAIKKWSAAVGYSEKNYTAAITATNSLSLFTASYFHVVNPQVQAGAKATWDKNAGSNVGLEVATRYALDPSSFVKAKINERGIAALAYNVKLSTNATLGLGLSMDTQNLSQAAHKNIHSMLVVGGRPIQRPFKQLSTVRHLHQRLRYLPATNLRDVEKVEGAHAFVVRSTSWDPYINLAIENYLLTHSKPNSRIFFFYVNRPCVVIGRNQNPWLETDLSAFIPNEPLQTAELVRRRSGGGTVYHDHGNLNYCAIMPPSLFSRNLHAQILADALTNAEIEGKASAFRVNDRHDVVIHRAGEEYKTSGSAYKLTKNRALHHGTCLVRSDLKSIAKYLGSPARQFIHAKGVESTRSRVDNIIRDVDWVALDPQHKNMPDIFRKIIMLFVEGAASTELSGSKGFNSASFLETDGSAYPQMDQSGLSSSDKVATYLEADAWRKKAVDLGAPVPETRRRRMDALNKIEDIVDSSLRLGEPEDVIKEIGSVAEELRDNSWKFLQTPRFTFTSHPEASPEHNAAPDNAKSSASAPVKAPFSLESRITLHVKSGVIEEHEGACVLPSVNLNGTVLHKINDWKMLVDNRHGVANWLNQTLFCAQ